MNKILTHKLLKIFSGLAVLAAFVAVVVPSQVAAFELKGGQKLEVEADKTVKEDLYIGAGQVDIYGTVLGDLFVGANQVHITGTTTEDILAAGNKVVFSGTSEGDVRLLGSDIKVSGTASSSLIAIGATVDITSEADIGGDVLILAGNTTVSGQIAGSLTVRGGVVTLDGVVDGDVTVHADQLEVTSEAQISGSLTYYSASQAKISDKATIVGEVVFNKVKTETESESGFLSALAGQLLSFFTLIVGALALSFVFKSFSTEVVRRSLSSSWWKYLLLGFAVLVLTPISAIILLFSFLGLPFGILALLAYGIILIIAWFYAVVIVGSWIWKLIGKSENLTISWQGAVAGAVIYILIGLIPAIGWLLQFIINLIAVGAIVTIKWQKLNRR